MTTGKACIGTADPGGVRQALNVQPRACFRAPNPDPPQARTQVAAADQQGIPTYNLAKSEQTHQRPVRSPEAWYRALPPATSSAEITGCNPALIKHFRNNPRETDQPSLNSHVVAIHLGGPKRVWRTRGKNHVVADVELNSLTLMPAYQANSWRVEGPVEYAHLTISVGAVEQFVIEEYDREPATHRLHESVGLVDPLLEQVFLALLQLVNRGSWSRLHLDSLLIVFTASLLDRHSSLSAPRDRAASSTVPRRGGLAGWQRRRVIDHMHEHMHTDMALGDLAKLTGLSRAHFFRAFRQSTGQSPGQILCAMRMRQAVHLLESTTIEIDGIAASLGFAHTRHFASAFAKRIGITPRLFRASQQ